MAVQLLTRIAKNTVHQRMRQYSSLYVADEFSQAALFLQGANANLNMKRPIEAHILATIASQRIDRASADAKATANGFRAQIAGFHHALFNQLLKTNQQVEGERSKLTPEQYTRLHQQVNQASDALTRCAAAIRDGELHKAKGKSVRVELLLHNICTAFQFDVRLSEKKNGSAKR